jgi:hypothetical protein
VVEFLCPSFLSLTVDALKTCSGLQDSPSRIEQSGMVLSVEHLEGRAHNGWQSVSHRASQNKTLLASFRTIFEQHRPSHHGSPIFERDIQNAVLFMRSQREYKVKIATLLHAGVSDLTFLARGYWIGTIP